MPCKRFRIVGDNTNFNAGDTHERQSSGKGSHMEHWFGSIAIVQNVTFNERPDVTSQYKPLELPVETFIMKDCDWCLIKNDFKVLVARILIDISHVSILPRMQHIKRFRVICQRKLKRRTRSYLFQPCIRSYAPEELFSDLKV